MGKIFKKAHNGAHWTVQVWYVNHLAKPFPAADTAQVKGVALLEVKIDKVEHCKRSIRHGVILPKIRKYINEAGLH